MKMELVQTKSSEPEDPDEDYEDELHDVNAIIMDLCIALGDTKAFEFHISGFGEERWPVDVATDLATVLEQIPAAIKASSNGAPFQVELFEQGIERSLAFEPNGSGCYQVKCNAGGAWEPKPESEELSQDEVLGMLVRLGVKFCVVAKAAFPRTSRHPWFQEFENGLKAYADF